jgi:hypothetical protein
VLGVYAIYEYTVHLEYVVYCVIVYASIKSLNMLMNFRKGIVSQDLR